MNIDKKTIVSGALVLALGVGVAVGTSLNALQANAQSTTPITTQTQQNPDKPTGQVDKPKGGHVGANGKREEVLTGDTASKVTTAAKAAVPGGTVDIVETDVEGAAYEAHMTKSDGSRVTVKFDTSFKVTSVDTGNK